MCTYIIFIGKQCGSEFYNPQTFFLHLYGYGQYPYSLCCHFLYNVGNEALGFRGRVVVFTLLPLKSRLKCVERQRKILRYTKFAILANVIFCHFI